MGVCIGVLGGVKRGGSAARALGGGEEGDEVLGAGVAGGVDGGVECRWGC